MAHLHHLLDERNWHTKVWSLKECEVLARYVGRVREINWKKDNFSKRIVVRDPPAPYIGWERKENDASLRFTTQSQPYILPQWSRVSSNTCCNRATHRDSLSWIILLTSNSNQLSVARFSFTVLTFLVLVSLLLSHPTDISNAHIPYTSYLIFSCISFSPSLSSSKYCKSATCHSFLSQTLYHNFNDTILITSIIVTKYQ